MAILDIRGTHGSGKSWIMRQLLHRYKSEPILENGQHIGYHLPRLGAALLGSYHNQCGGCDGIKSPAEVCRRVRLFAPRYLHVLLEGILVAHTFQTYSELAEELQEHDYKFLFLDTPLKVCIGRVRTRRKLRGNLKPLNTYWLEYDWHRINERVLVKCKNAGHQVVPLDWHDPLPTVIKLLQCRGPR